MPGLLRLRQRHQKEVALLIPGPVTSAGSADREARGERALARELLVMLAVQRGPFLEFVRRRVRSGADADDLLQQAMVKAAENVDSLRSNERVDAWFYRVLRNTITDHHRAWARQTFGLPTLSTSTTTDAGTPTVTVKCDADSADDLSNKDEVKDCLNAASNCDGAVACLLKAKK